MHRDKKYSIIFFPISFILLTIFIHTSASAQVTDRLFRQIPEDLKPANRNNLSDIDLRKIVGMAASYAAYDDTTMAELDKLARKLEGRCKQGDTSLRNIWNITFTGEYYRFYRDQPPLQNKYIQYYKTVIDLVHKSRNSDTIQAISNAYIAVGGNYDENHDYETAAEYYNRARLVSIAGKDSATTRSGMGTMAQMYLNLKMYPEAIDLFNQMPAYFEDTEYKDSSAYWMKRGILFDKIRAYTNWYDISKHQYLLDSVKRLLKEGEKMMPYVHNHFPYDAYYYYKGRECLYRSDYKNALSYFDSSQVAMIKRGSRMSAPRIYKAVALIGQKRKKEGMQLLKASIEDNIDPETNVLVYSLLAANAKDEGKWKEAYLYDDLRERYEDSIKIMSERGKVFAVNRKYAVKEKEAIILKLDLANQTEIRRRNMLLSGLLGVTIIFILGIVLVVKKRQVDKLRATQDLRAAQNKLEQIIWQQDKEANEIRRKTITEQRQLISRDMHDELSSELSALKYRIGIFKIKSATPHEKEILQLLETETNEVYIKARNYMHNLQKGLNNTPADLTGFLKTLSEQYSDPGFFRIKLDLNIHEIAHRLDAEQQYQLDHIFKEAITNTMKHTQSKEVTLTVHFNVGDCHFSIQDNGDGFRNTTHAGIGLESMKERAELLGGSLTIISSSQGTLISGSFPLPLTATPYDNTLSPESNLI